MAGCGSNPHATAPLVTFTATPALISRPASLVVYADGKAVVEPDRCIRLPRAALDRLRLQLTRSRFSRLRAYYGPAVATDQPTFTIRFSGRMVRTETGSPPAPRRLWRLVGDLGGIVDQARRAPARARCG
jgi:hypothetical protein